MAGDWIKFEVDTFDKPEVWALAQELCLPVDAVVGKLLRVWSWFDAHTEDGNAPSVTTTLLDHRVGVTGFCQALVNVGWMHLDDSHVSLPNFERHNGQSAKKRALTAKRVADHRKRTSNGKSVTREEKRRIEKITTPTLIPPNPVDNFVRHHSGKNRNDNRPGVAGTSEAKEHLLAEKILNG
tara:strand:+ start:134 stop:679 length:546 start_codon:yes stop_codon:yes gene_type:complete